MNKPNNNVRRPRGRPQGKRSNQRSRGSQPHGRPRANPKPQLEKYRNLAREAEQAGDRITAENYWQYVDHYQRQLNEMQPAKTNNDPQEGADNNNNVPSDGPSGDVNEGHKRPPVKRRGPPQRNNNSDTVPETASNSDKKIDLAESKQPAEIRPELDIAAEVPATPRRRGRPKKIERPNPDQPSLDLNEGAPKPAKTSAKPNTDEGGEAA